MRIDAARRLESVLQDIRFAARGLRRSPAFTVTVILTFALGIGANTAIFGIIDRLMLRPFPYLRDQGAVHRVYLQSTLRNTRITGSVGEYTRYTDLTKFSASFERTAAMTSANLAVGQGLESRERTVGIVTASFFDFFDAPPALGRYFAGAEDTTPRGADVAVLSHEFWQSAYAGSRDVLGKTLQVNNILCVVIGVLPKGFVGIWEGSPPAVYIPATTYANSSPARQDAETYYSRYNWGWLDMMVRRKPGVSVDAASADLSQAFVKSWNAMLAQEPGTPLAVAKPVAVAGSLKQAAGPDPSVEAKTLRWVAGVAIIVLLIACSNVANLFLARALRRRRETAVRIALGVGRGQLVRQWFTESLLLAFAGCAAGLLIAQWGGASLRALFVGTGAAIPVVTDWRTLGVSASLAVLTAILAATVPALVVGRGEIAGALKAGAREGTYRHSRLRTALLVTQITLSAVLLVGAGVFVRSFSHVRALRLGYETDQALLVSRNLRGLALTDTQTIELGRQLLAAAQRLPIVEHAAVVSSIPFYSTSSTSFRVDGIDSVARLGRFTYQTGTPDYFATMQTRILRGRAFDEHDRSGSELVVVVSASMAKVLWPTKDAIGQCIYIGRPDAPCTRIIGVAEDAAQNQLLGNDRFRYYLPLDQYLPRRGSYIVARVRGDLASASETIRKALQPLMPGQGYITTRPISSIVANQQRAWRFGATMFMAYGVLALVVASLGLYGVIGYNVAQRMHELGVRIALGAQGRHVISLVMSQGLIVAIAGVAAGTGIALALSAKIQPLLFQQSARDPVVFGVVAATLVASALVACAVPARRAAGADPNRSLRAD